MLIYRNATVFADPSTFRQPDLVNVPENLILTPPAPFSGSGTLQRTPESTFAWTGPLTVEFPGADPVKLTGPTFLSHFCALRGCAVQTPKGLLN